MMFNWFKKGSTMNPLEQAAQTIVISLLKDIEANHKQIINLVTLGKLTPEKVETINQDILWALRMLHPLFDVAHALIPESTPILHDIMDWCQAIYHQVIEPVTPK
jgi:hypothetical protein